MWQQLPEKHSFSMLSFYHTRTMPQRTHSFSGGLAGCTLQCLLQVAFRKHQIILKLLPSVMLGQEASQVQSKQSAGMCWNILSMFHAWIWRRQERLPSAIFLCTKSSHNPCGSTFMPRKTSLRQLLPQWFVCVSYCAVLAKPVQHVEAKQPRN